MAATSSFGKAFAAARKAGKKTFTWNGKKYTTKTREEAGMKASGAPSKIPSAPERKPSSPRSQSGSGGVVRSANASTTMTRPKRKPSGRTPTKPAKVKGSTSDKSPGRRLMDIVKQTVSGSGKKSNKANPVKDRRNRRKGNRNK